MKVEFATVIFGRGVPDPEGVIFAAGEEVVCAWVEGKRGYCFRMALKVAKIGVIMGREVSDCICDEI